MEKFLTGYAQDFWNQKVTRQIEKQDDRNEHSPVERHFQNGQGFFQNRL
jgi:hypothetical protein